MLTKDIYKNMKTLWKNAAAKAAAKAVAELKAEWAASDNIITRLDMRFKPFIPPPPDAAAAAQGPYIGAAAGMYGEWIPLIHLLILNNILSSSLTNKVQLDISNSNCS